MVELGPFFFFFFSSLETVYKHLLGALMLKRGP